MILAFADSLLAIFALAAVLFHRSTHGLLATRRKRQVLVTLKSGESFAGLLMETDRDALVLRESTAIAYGKQAENVAVQGEAVILRADVAYMQFP